MRTHYEQCEWTYSRSTWRYSLMILDRLDQASPEELMQGVFQLLLSGTADRATYEKMRDPRLIPVLTTIIQANGRPDFSPTSLSAQHAEKVLTSAAYLLGDIARPDDQAAVQALSSLLDQDNNHAALAAAVALGQIGAMDTSEKIVAFTERMLAQGDLGAIARLTRTLAQIGDDNARTCLEKIVAQEQKSDDKHARHVVAEAEKSIQEIDNRTA
jgi:hypothetical protein